MYVVFHSNFASYIVYRRYKPCEFLEFVWTDCWGNKSNYVITSPANRTLTWCGERVSSCCEHLHEIICQISTSNIRTRDGLRESITFVDGYSVGGTITTVKGDTSSATRSIHGKYGLDGDVHGWGVESFKHNLHVNRGYKDIKIGPKYYEIKNHSDVLSQKQSLIFCSTAV